MTDAGARALRDAWLASDSPVLVHLDVDLSTDLAALLVLLVGTPLILLVWPL